ncbi:type II toxin-antitoxin system HipA family toxin [Desulfobacula sp.]|uniref:type II toxin-antitoxin system HipA family toxin n=1 Tax=Desulfobacula sp. TaxID=2593537 RepID=UPI0026388F16|nr:type II toxin-antitoxin system HipA family toxin [Desulfobacula sp.]
MKSKLNVFVNQLKAGELWLDQQRRFCFQYDKSWINSPDSCRLSISLPLREDPYLNDDSYSYFTNLLPEGEILNVLSRKLQIPVSNQFELLKAVGGDCAGAVSLFEDGALPPKPTAYSYKILTDDHLTRIIKELPENPFMANDPGIRLSLAGAQEKLPVSLKDNKIGISMNGAPSSHILKTPIKDLHGTVENETFCMMLARKMGLLVPDVKIITINEIPLYIIDRYDRKIENGQIIRLIQEDFCQALNVNAQLKYTPTLDVCFSLIRNESAVQVKDTKRFLQLIIFNGLIGNSDAHAKNVSFIHGEKGTILAPFYDLLSTYVYPYAKKMAMKVGGGRHFQFLEPRHFERFSKDTLIKYKVVKETLVTMADKIAGEAKNTTEEFFDLYGKSPVLNEINDVIKNSSKEKLKFFS